jgi:drug/metabolite transporter (DMT)-like permease
MDVFQFVLFVYTYKMSSIPTPRHSTLIIALLAGILSVSTAAIFIRLSQHEGAPSIVIAAARLTIASLILAPFALSNFKTELQRLSRREWILAILSGLFLALHFTAWITSLEYTSVASSVVLVTTTPLWVALLAPLVVQERIGRAGLVGLFISMMGGAFIGLSDSCTWLVGAVSCPQIGSLFLGKAILGDFLALIGAWMAAGYMLVGRKLRAKMELIPYIFIVYAISAFILLILMIVMQGDPLALAPITYLWLALLAIVPQLFGHSIFNWVLKYMPVSYVSVSLLGEPVASTLLAFLFFQEQLGWIKIGGSLLILAGIWLTAVSTSSR